LTLTPDRKSTVQWKRTNGRMSLLIVTSTVFAMTLTAQVMPKTTRRECVMLLPLDTLKPYVSDPDECVVKTESTDIWLCTIGLSISRASSRPGGLDEGDRPI
jgi:hypothetical protein